MSKVIGFLFIKIDVTTVNGNETWVVQNVRGVGQYVQEAS